MRQLTGHPVLGGKSGGWSRVAHHNAALPTAAARNVTDRVLHTRLRRISLPWPL